jgi:DNA primase
MWAPCPFHQEKSASFHVDDRKGFYYCFGCHAKGDAISFVRETENVGFMEAVEILARETGMPMPERDPQAQQKADRRALLAEVMEQAVRFFRLQLNTGAAAQARDYLARRGLDTDALERWEIGFAPDQWQGLWDHLKAKNVDDDLIHGAGLAKPSNRGGKPYDTFRGRIMFPIRDGRGRAIAFGGRAMDPNDNAKYLNSPETELFDKGRSLFNFGPARTASGKGQPLIVAEGYMDVIALSSAGFEASVAPLGTAITETQMQLLWRISPEPIIALDGDTAGLRAAMRLIDLALPMLEAGRSLRFALMPAGKDPDDLLREQGASALQRRLDAALPMVRLLWQRETEGRVFDSPERKAALDKALHDKTQLIKDPSIRNHYAQELKDLKWRLFRGARTPTSGARKTGGRWAQAPAAARSTTKASALVTAQTPEVAEHMRESVILAALATCPSLIEGFEAELERMRCSDPFHADLRSVLLSNMGADADSMRQKISERFEPGSLENLLGRSHVAINPCIRAPGDPEKTRMTVAEELAKLHAARGLDAEIAEAAEDLGGMADEGLTWRLSEAAKAAQRALRSEQEDKGEVVVADNGVKLDAEQLRISRESFDSIDFTRGGRTRN